MFSTDLARRSTSAFLVALAGAVLLAPRPSHAQSLISRTITIDGDMSDWHAAPSILANPVQYSTDCKGSEGCDLDNPQSTGRDLRTFSFTWDDENVYFYVERFSSANNRTEWLFYIDEDVDGRLEAGEHFFHVSWWGSNRRTNASLCDYVPANPAGDSIGGDGYTMPGQSGGCSSVHSGVTGGSSSGLEMESRLPWASLGKSGPVNLGFHISSSRGLNLPGHVEDNMMGSGGSGGGQLFPPDMMLMLNASAQQVAGFAELAVVVELKNVYYDPFSDIAIGIALPNELIHVSHAAPSGTSFVDTDGDEVPDTWHVQTLQAQETRVLEIVLRGATISTTTHANIFASIAGWSGIDSDSTNNVGALNIEVLPSPELTMTMAADPVQAVPGDNVTYIMTITNDTEASAHDVIVVGAIDSRLAFCLDAFGPSQPFQFVDGSPFSGLVMGTLEFSADGGSTWSYQPVSGGGGAPAGYDANVTHWRIQMAGIMNPNGAHFEIRYKALIR